MRIKHTIKTDNTMHGDSECYFSSNFREIPGGGVAADYRLTQRDINATSTTAAGLNTIRGFIQREYNDKTTVFGKNYNGDIYLTDEHLVTYYRTMHYDKTPGSSRGINVDINNEIVYTGNRYLGKTITTTAGEMTSVISTITVYSVTDFPSSGYAFIRDDHTAYSEAIQYTGINSTNNQLTGVTRGKFNTNGRAHSAGEEIIGFDDDWKDLGVATSEYRPILRWEDYIFVGNGNKVAGYKETDASDWSTELLDLPEDYEIVDFSTLLTGGGLKILIGANLNNQGKIFVWDGSSDSWERSIPLNDNILRMYDNFIATKLGVYQTDGYSAESMAELPDDAQDAASANFDVIDINRQQNFLLFTLNTWNYSRTRGGLWLLNLDKGTWSYVVPSGNFWYGVRMGAIFVGTDRGVIVSHSDGNIGAIDNLITNPTPRGSYYWFNYNPKTAQELSLQEVILNVSPQIKGLKNNKKIDWDIILRYYDYRSPFLQNNQINATSSASTIKVYSSLGLGVPSVGDRVEIVDGEYTSGAPDIYSAARNITAISSNSTSYSLTLDEDLPAAVNSTANAWEVVFNPLKKAKKISINSTTFDLKDLRIPFAKAPKFKQMLFEVEFRCDADSPAPQLNAVDIISETRTK